MYINKNNNFFHGVMFHHFHDKKNTKKDRDQFQEMNLTILLNLLEKKYIRSKRFY